MRLWQEVQALPRGLTVSERSAPGPWWEPPECLALGHGGVHIWRAGLDRSDAEVKRLERSLSPAERASCARVHRPRARRDAIAARALLRSVLSRYLGLDPAVLDFRLGPQGKPSLSGAGALQFNLSHSDGLALCAVASGRRVGVDLERIRPDVAVEQISERYFSAREASVIRLLPDAVKRRAFFRCWTQKEAYLKATGKGIASSLGGFSVSAAPGEPAGLLDVDRDPLEASRWELAELTPGPGYVGALAVEGHGWRLALWDASTTLRAYPTRPSTPGCGR